MKSLTDQLQIAYQEGLDKGKGLQIGMADPLPHPSKDVPQRPNPNAPPSSPWEPYKSPAPSRDDKLVHRSHKPSFTHDGIPRYVTPGTHNPKQHNPPVDPAGNPIESLRPKDSDIPLPGYDINQSSNIPTAMPQSGTAFPVGNMNPLIAQGQTNLLNPFQLPANLEKVDQVREGTYKGGKGGMVDKIFKNQSDRNSQLRELMEQAGM